jgi:hypothetical protein
MFDSAGWHDLGAFPDATPWALSGTATELWLSGTRGSADSRGVVWRWDGSGWTEVYASPAGASAIYSMSSPRPGVAWTVEVLYQPTPGVQARVLRWDGAGFQEAARFPAYYVVAESDTDVMTFGDSLSLKTEVRHFDGASWNLLATFSGTQSASYFVPPGGPGYVLTNRGGMFVRATP